MKVTLATRAFNECVSEIDTDMDLKNIEPVQPLERVQQLVQIQDVALLW